MGKWTLEDAASLIPKEQPDHVRIKIGETQRFQTRQAPEDIQLLMVKWALEDTASFIPKEAPEHARIKIGETQRFQTRRAPEDIAALVGKEHMDHSKIKTKRDWQLLVR